MMKDRLAPWLEKIHPKKKPTVTIRLSEVGIPPEPTLPHDGCGGTLTYGSFPYLGESVLEDVSGKIVRFRAEAPEIWGYRCDNCLLTLYLPEMGEQLDETVLEALANLGIIQSA